MLFSLVLVLALFLSVVLGLAQVILFFTGRRDRPPVPSGCLLAAWSPVVLWLLLLAVGEVFSPVHPTKEDITGKYEIDRNFHPGRQADWQHATYSLEIFHDHLVLRDRRTTTEWKYDINWFLSPEYRWTFRDKGPRHHMVSGGPAIIREWSGYYYVFESPLYGEVVFRKEPGFPLARVLGGAVVVGLVLAWGGKRWPGRKVDRADL